MKNFNRRSSHGHHGSKGCKLAQHAHWRGSHAFTHTLTVTQLQPRCAKCWQLSYYRIWNGFFVLKAPEGGEANRRTWRKPPDSLSANHNRGKNPTSRTRIEPSTSNSGDKLAWPRVCTASDPQAAAPGVTTCGTQAVGSDHMWYSGCGQWPHMVLRLWAVTTCGTQGSHFHGKTAYLMQNIKANICISSRSMRLLYTKLGLSQYQ